MSEDYKELELKAFSEYNLKLEQARLRHEEAVKLARQAEKQAFVDAHQRIEEGNDFYRECRDRLERAIRKTELLELVRAEEKKVAEAAETTRQTVRQAREDEERDKSQAKAEYEKALRDIAEIKEAQKALSIAERRSQERAWQASEKTRISESEKSQKLLAEKQKTEQIEKRLKIEEQALKQETEKKNLHEKQQADKEKHKADKELVKQEELKKQKEEAALLAKDAVKKKADSEQGLSVDKPPGITPLKAINPAGSGIRALESRYAVDGPYAPGKVPVYQGAVKLVMSAASEYAVVRELENSLNEWPDVKLVLTGGEDTDIEMILSVSKPLDLVSRLASLPIVQDVKSEGERIRLSFKCAPR